jgi:hypothetical protein
MNKPIIQLLKGTFDNENALSKLRAQHLILENINDDINTIYEKHIDRESISYIEIFPNFLTLEFPTPTGININMMPIILNRSAIPEEYHSYIDIINKVPIPFENRDKIMYLTIHEEFIKSEETHRRPGLHIERPGSIINGGEIVKYDVNDPKYLGLRWGLGYVSEQGIPIDGIYMASNVCDSCSVYNCLIDKPEEVTDKFGGIEHMKWKLGEPEFLKANKLYWITDRTPHESLPMKTDTWRQFFRLIVGDISVWYSKHNTPNPLGIMPNAPIVDDDKFT